MGSVAVDPRRLGNVLARLLQSPSEAVRFAVQAELNAEAIDQQREMFEAKMSVERAKSAVEELEVPD